jgi:prepilin-type N-terminal cleavage/methylation domain-containing protein
MRNLTHTQRRPGGFTIVELLIAVIIIGILVAVIIPIYVNRAEDARIATAQADMDAISTAQQHAAIDTGYFYRVFVLDDVSGGDSVSPDNNTDVVDGIVDERLRNDAGNMPNIFIDTKFGTLLTNGSVIYDRLINSETSFNWNGPYINVARKSGPKFGRPLNVPYSTPIDPWGNPYLLFTREGLMNDVTGLLVTSYSTGTGTYNAQVFDRPTILSMGANGVPGTGAAGSRFGEGDDLYRQF